MFFLPGGRPRREGRAPSPTPSGCCSGRTRPSSRRATRARELWFFYHLGRGSGETLAGSTDARDRPLLDLTWDYPPGRTATSRRPRHVLRRDQRLRPDRPAAPSPASPSSRPTARRRAAAGSTAASTPTASTRPRAASPAEQDWVAGEWGWAWPANRRILYNRASADPDGKPWSERKALRLVGRRARRVDRPRRAGLREGPSRPSYRPPEGAVGPGRAARRRPVHHAVRRQGLAVRADRAWLDGPLPTHYEPHESPVAQPALRPAGQPDPQGLRPPGQPVQPVAAELHGEVFPFVFTTARLTEHHTAGGMSRTLPYLSELQPELFVEVSPELAARARARAPRLGACDHQPRGRRGQGRSSPTGCAPLRVQGRIVHQIWMPYHWGPVGPRHRATSSTTCSAWSLDPNVLIQESKVGHLRHPAWPPAARAAAAVLPRRLPQAR